MTYEEALEADIRRARAKQPPELRDKFCVICGPFFMTCCPAAPEHWIRAAVGSQKTEEQP
jgi:hypothetical protein